jgi:hypothetical protein
MGVCFDFLEINENLGNQTKTPSRVKTDQIEPEISPFYSNLTPSEIAFVIYEAQPIRLINSNNVVDLAKPVDSKRKTPDKNLLIYWAITQTSSLYGKVSEETTKHLSNCYKYEKNDNWFEVLFGLKPSQYATIYFSEYAMNIYNKAGVPQLGHLFPRAKQPK